MVKFNQNSSRVKSIKTDFKFMFGLGIVFHQHEQLLAFGIQMTHGSQRAFQSILQAFILKHLFFGGNKNNRSDKSRHLNFKPRTIKGRPIQMWGALVEWLNAFLILCFQKPITSTKWQSAKRITCFSDDWNNLESRDRDGNGIFGTLKGAEANLYIFREKPVSEGIQICFQTLY